MSYCKVHCKIFPECARNAPKTVQERMAKSMKKRAARGFCRIRKPLVIHLSYGAVRVFASVYNAALVFWLYKSCTCVKSRAKSRVQLQHCIMHFLIPNVDVTALRRAHVIMSKDALDHHIVNAEVFLRRLVD